MIRGYFLTRGTRHRPFVKAILQFPTLQDGTLEVEMLVDTGADRTTLAPVDVLRLARRFQLDLSTLPPGIPSTGVGGRAATRTIEAAVILDSFTSPRLTLTMLEPPSGSTPPIPSLLGRDILSHFALYIEERTRRVLLLEPPEADALHLP